MTVGNKTCKREKTLERGESEDLERKRLELRAEGESYKAW